jgi:DNA polymerase-1
MTLKIPIQNSNVYLIDTSSLIFRAFYAIPNLTSPKGEPVNALYGFINMILKLLSEKNPDHILFCQDSKTKGYRYEIYPQYKANRGEMPESLASQLPLIFSFIDKMGFPRIQVEGVEADDIIGTLAHHLAQNQNEVVIVSSDKDFAQLISPHIILYDTMKDVFYKREDAISKWGVTPEQMIDYLALIGDSSDNIPGVTGVGPKTAVNLLTQFGTLDEIYEQIDQVKGATKQRLMENKEMAYLSKKLVTINRSLDLNIAPEQLLPKTMNKDEILSFIEQYHFKSLIPVIQRIIQSPILETPTTEETFRLQPIEFELQAFQKFVKKKPDSLWIYFQKDVVTISDGNAVMEIPKDSVPLVSDSLSKVTLSGSNLKNLAHAIGLSNLRVGWDNAIAAYVENPGQSVELDSLVRKYLNKTLQEYRYPVEAEIELADKLKYQVESQFKIIQEIELPLIEVLYKMELRGVLIDSDWLIEERSHLFEELQSIEKKIYELTGKEFNVNSPKQLASVLFEDLKLPAHKKTKTGYSTDNEVLEALENQHPVIGEILKYRELSKLKSTYVDPLPQMMDQNGRIHTTFQQTVTATGRLSSTNPNLQNIPIRTDRGERLRAAFIAPEGCSLGAFDYSQIELRILAHVSEDPGLIKAFEQNQDIHSATASEVFEIDIHRVTPEQRRIAKAINFGIAYGQTAFGLSQTLGISRKSAQDIIDRYFKKFSKVRDYIHSTIESAKKLGYVETLLGRRRYIPDILSRNGALQKFAERAAINAPMQGSAADIVKLAMIKVERECQSKLILQVHDELIFEAPDQVLLSEAVKIQTIMETIIPLKVPLKVNYGIGKNWREAH